MGAGMSKPLFAPLTLSVILGSLSVAAAAPPVVGGTTTKPEQFPDVVAVLAPDGACSGTLVAPDVVLTAGHCTSEITPTMVVVDTIDYGKVGGELIAVKSVHPYPKWETTYDVGVLVLAHPARAKPRAVARACNVESASTVRVVGFGLTSTAGTGNNTRLHQAVLPIDDARCLESPDCNQAVAPDGEFVAGGAGTDSCFGDSGGPAFVGTKAPALLGVVSRGLALPGRPCGNGGIYVRADKVVPWIEKVSGRKLVRASCTGAADEPVVEEEAPVADGCSVGGGVAQGMGMIVLLPGLVWRRKKVKK
jgi:secreted trypsin-like serine protease